MRAGFAFAFAFAVVVSMIIGQFTSVEAAPLRFLNIRHVEADPNNPYWLAEGNGPWCILASSFAGEGAQKDAHELVIELRKRYGVEAYMHQRTYDYSQSVQGLGVDRYGAPKRMKYLQGGRYDEVAVLAGNFSGVTEPEVERTLEKLKYAKPECLKIGGERTTTQRFAGLRSLQKAFNASEEKHRRGPMGSAFVTRNPMLPDEFFAPGGVDKFVLNMNKNVEHSLLDCPGNYSVRVATFRGNVILDQAKISNIKERGAEMDSRLDVAANNAHNVVVALRKQGVLAYEFHDRHESIVTVGSFDSVTLPQRRDDGRQEINPAVHEVMKQYGSTAQQIPGGGTSPGMKPRRVAGIFLDAQPMPVEVPKRSIGADYARGQ